MREAANSLKVSMTTLEKWCKRLGIEPERHPQDWRFRTITEAQLQQIAEERAKMPAATTVAHKPNMPPALLRAKSDALDSSPDRFPIPTIRKRRQQPLSASPAAREMPAGAMGRDNAALLHGLPTATVRFWAARGELETHAGEYGPPGQWRTKQPLTARGLRQLYLKAHGRGDWIDCELCPHAEQDEP